MKLIEQDKKILKYDNVIEQTPLLNLNQKETIENIIQEGHNYFIRNEFDNYGPMYFPKASIKFIKWYLKEQLGTIKTNNCNLRLMFSEYLEVKNDYRK